MAETVSQVELAGCAQVHRQERTKWAFETGSSLVLKYNMEEYEEETRGQNRAYTTQTLHFLLLNINCFSCMGIHLIFVERINH